MKLKALLTFLFFAEIVSAQNYFEKIYQNQSLSNLGTMDISPSDKGFVFSGTQTEDYFLFKGDSLGNLQWSRTYDSLNLSEYSSGVCHLTNGRFAFIGSGEYYYGDNMATVGEVDSIGNNVQWTTYPLHDEGWSTFGISICTNPLGGYHFIMYEDGYLWTNYYYFDYDSVCGFDGSEYSTNSLSANPTNVTYACTVNDVLPYPQLVGTTVVSNISTRTNAGQGLNTTCIQSDNDSGYVIGNNGQFIQLRKFNSSNVFQWNKNYVFNSNSRIVDIEQNSNGDFFLLINQDIGTGSKIVLMSANSSGDSLWSRSFYGYGYASPINLKLYDNGDIIIFGSTFYDPYIIKTNSLGQINPQYSISGNGNFFCDGDTAILTVQGGGATFLWSTGDTTQSIRLTSSNIASVIVTNSSGISSNTGIYGVTFFNQPIAEISSFDSIISCSTFSMIDSVVNDVTTQYTWSLNDTLISSYSSGYISHSGIVKLVVRNFCGIDSDMVYVNIPFNPAPTLFASPGTNFCEGDSVLLTVNYPASVFLWRNFQDTLLLNNFFGSSVYVKEGGIYRVRYVGTEGCLSNYSNPIALINRTPDSIVLHNSSLTFCQGDSVVLFALNDYNIYNYFWSSGDTTVSVSVKNPGCYSFHASSSWGCTSTSDTVCVTVLNNPTINLGADTIVCINSPVTLDAGVGYSSYLWQDSTNSQSISVNSSIADTIDYSVVVTNSDNCIAMDTITLVYDLCNYVNDDSQFDQIRIYPNPSTETFKVYLSDQNNENGVISIYDLSGKEIRKIQLSGKDISDGIEISGLSRGVYCVRYNSAREEFTELIVIQ